jgi:hypothetical protein
MELSMKCPHCEFDLVLADRQDVEIYFCQNAGVSGWIAAHWRRSSSDSPILSEEKITLLGKTRIKIPATAT